MRNQIILCSITEEQFLHTINKKFHGDTFHTTTFICLKRTIFQLKMKIQKIDIDHS